jgi:hypothetical protein
MPFTFSHAVVVLPFLKNRNLSATGLIVGAMAPDLEFFFRMRTQSVISHTLPGLFWIDLPLAILVVLLFHGILKKTVLLNLPFFLQSRLTELKTNNWFDYFRNNIIKVFVSFLIGASTHFFLDAFTHSDGFFVQKNIYLQMSLLSFPVYEWLQYGTSIIGLLILGFYFFQIPKDKTCIVVIHPIFWCSVLFFSVLFLSLRFSLVVGWDKIGDTILGVLSSIVLAFVFSSILFKRH